MMRTMVYLPDNLHKSIKHLAIERGTSFAKLVAEALESLYREDIEDLKIGHQRLEEVTKKDDKTILYSEYRKTRNKS